MSEDRIVEKVRSLAQDRFSMPLDGIHGTVHWGRVHENGVYLSKHSKADLTIVRLFAYLHDCCRESDGSDPAHGLRAAEFAASLRTTALSRIDNDRLELLYYACEYHEKGMVSKDKTIGTCWDSDRLDLGRAAIRPIPKLLSTKRAQSKTVIDWAYRRSRGQKAKLKA